MTKRLLAAALAAILTFSLAACGENSSTPTQSANLPSAGSGGDSVLGTDFQKNMHQTASTEISYLCETENGYYFQYDAFAYYIDKATKTATILCAKPDCAHNDNTCNAWIFCTGLSYSGGKLYFPNNDYVLNNGTYTNYGIRLYSVDLDGTNRSAVQSLEFTPGGDTSPYITSPIIHRGNVYFVYSGVLYGIPLGDEIENAAAIYGEEIAGSTSGSTVIDSSSIQYQLWADGDDLYFMTNVKQSGGTYKDTLFAYDTVNKEVTQVWQTPDAAEVGEWERTSVAVSQWYVMDSYLYFYLSGGDMWRTDLETGKHEKLASTSERTKYGAAVFSEQYMCLLNDAPTNAVGLGGGIPHTGGDTIYVYGLDGTFVKELSLAALSEYADEIEHCEMLFCSGDEIYFLADAGAWSDPVNGVSTRDIDLILCCVSIDSGEITQIYRWN